MTQPLYRHELPYSSPSRDRTMQLLKDHLASIPPLWTFHLAASSLTVTSKDKTKIVKIDSCMNYTLDVRRPDGTYKSTRFPCKSVEEAWSMAAQIFKVHRSNDAIH